LVHFNHQKVEEWAEYCAEHGHPPESLETGPKEDDNEVDEVEDFYQIPGEGIFVS
jgi:hypothetical protein